MVCVQLTLSTARQQKCTVPDQIDSSPTFCDIGTPSKLKQFGLDDLEYARTRWDGLGALEGARAQT